MGVFSLLELEGRDIVGWVAMFRTYYTLYENGHNSFYLRLLISILQGAGFDQLSNFTAYARYSIHVSCYIAKYCFLVSALVS